MGINAQTLTFKVMQTKKIKCLKVTSKKRVESSFLKCPLPFLQHLVFIEIATENFHYGFKRHFPRRIWSIAFCAFFNGNRFQATDVSEQQKPFPFHRSHPWFNQTNFCLLLRINWDNMEVCKAKRVNELIHE